VCHLTRRGDASSFVVPAEAGTQSFPSAPRVFWAPACAGVTPGVPW
jgi:hypothetical protein